MKNIGMALAGLSAVLLSTSAVMMPGRACAETVEIKISESGSTLATFVLPLYPSPNGYNIGYEFDTYATGTVGGSAYSGYLTFESGRLEGGCSLNRAQYS
jgi:hypothetical protein